MANRLFSQVPGRKQKRNLFDLSHDVKMSMDMGILTPMFCQEVVPGDTFILDTEVFLRLAPMIAPMMHRCNIKTDFFFVPNRLLWNEWEDFITGGEDGTAAPVFPYFTYSDLQDEHREVGSLPDYFGVPVGQGNLNPGLHMSVLPFRAYQMIYNEYFRDQNLTPPVEFDIDSGALSDIERDNVFELRRRCWEKDYFTAALPWAQRGEPVLLPFGGVADLVYDPDSLHPTKLWNSVGGSTPAAGSGNLTYNANLTDDTGTRYAGVLGSQQFDVDVTGNTRVDLSEATSVTINDLRRSIKLQQWLENNARGGSRYIEQILSHFGVRSSDSRLQRPEYLGGGKTPVKVSEVLQTSSSDDVTPQANMAGHGIAVGRSHRFKRFFEEHGLVIGLISVIPRTSYMQGLPRYFMKSDKTDFFWPEFANLGEQPVYNAEIYALSAGPYDPVGTFGYQPRYAEYKYIPSSVHGKMRTDLDFWHMGRVFSPQEENYPPALNTEFVECRPTDRIWSVIEAEHLYVHLFHRVRAIRPMPKFGVPML
ncbi:major capsid protein [Peromfec virus RodF8_52]|uniref:Major capsid protein n=1 Tax=Peromfec virus RodF8_52 TaxID=2929381 RepID=A0A976R882_9VIRU|nr:major capsid protein [Peromfec virus RodF8_52]